MRIKALVNLTICSISMPISHQSTGPSGKMVVPQGGIETGHNEGMQKHRVDKRFDPVEDIDYAARKGARRGKRHRKN